MKYTAEPQEGQIGNSSRSQQYSADNWKDRARRLKDSACWTRHDGSVAGRPRELAQPPHPEAGPLEAKSVRGGVFEVVNLLGWL